MSDAAEAGNRGRASGFWRAVRWLLAFLLLVGFGLAAASNSYTECSVVRTATRLTSTCAPPTATSGSFLVVVLLVLVLVWPELSRRRSPAARLTGRLDRLEESNRETRERVDALSHPAQPAAAEAPLAASRASTPSSDDDATWGPERSALLQEQRHRLGGNDDQLTETRTDLDPGSAEARRYRTVGELVLRWQHLQNLLRLTPRGTVAVSISRAPEDVRRQSVRQAMAADLEAPLHSLRTLRNAAVRSPATPQEDIDTGLQLIDGLTRVVEDALDERRP
jgi:hypothetical protein